MSRSTTGYDYKKEQKHDKKALKAQHKDELKCLSARRKEGDFTLLPEEECSLRPERTICLTPPRVMTKQTTQPCRDPCETHITTQKTSTGKQTDPCKRDPCL
ncbi:hypothetical protein RCL1_003718 [Eukaryota sp. TZLM3-RCL]